MLATYAASRHRQIVPCCMISSVSHDNVSRLVTDRSMCFATALDKAFENIDCMSAILRCQAKNRFYESTQRLIQPRRVLCQIPYCCITLVSNFMPRYWSVHCERVGDGYRMPCAGFVDDLQLSTAKRINKVRGMLVTQMLRTGRESASQDTNLIVLVKLFARFLALLLDPQSVRLFASCDKRNN